MTRRTVRDFTAGLLLLLLVLSAGCGARGARPHVEGRVTFRGEPVGNQSLVLYSEGGPGEFFTQTIPIRADGTFSGEVAAPGTYTVVIAESLAAQEGRKTADKNPVSIPLKYRSRATSDLTWTVQKNNESREFSLDE